MNVAAAKFLFSSEILFQIKEIEEVVSTVVSVSAPEKKTFSKRVVLVVDKYSKENVDFALKVLLSVKVLEPEIEIVEVSQAEVYDFSSAKMLLAFGCSVPGIDLNTKYQANKNVLFADTLGLIQTNPNGEKRKLWEALKEMFGV